MCFFHDIFVPPEGKVGSYEMRTFLTRLNYKAKYFNRKSFSYECKINKGGKTLFSKYNY